MFTLYIVLLAILIYFISYEKIPQKFIIHKSRFIISIIAVSFLAVWYIDTESGKFNSGLAAVAIVSFICYWVISIFCGILNFFAKVYNFYKESKKITSSAPYKAAKEMTVKEAREILNVGIYASQSEILDSYLKLIANNDPHDGGSPYIGAKIENAKKLLMGH